ncbi:MAG: hypothetical protein LQ350_004786 [Teloschistes chrysophthalmus]|nr:MAG: hypothetical protein LQ350_004786 [Niorma chrysophthalma]
MASSSPEAETKRRKPFLDNKRDDPRPPRVAPRRAISSVSQQAPIFETESILNTSNAQTPSPIKPTTRPSPRPQHRKAFSVGRSLAPTYAPTPKKTDENKPPSSQSFSRRDSGRQTPLKPRPSQTPRPTTRSSDKKPGPSGSPRLRTPSPARGRRTHSITSPISTASSPPRGLAEAYQRIVDEQNLADEESIEEMASYNPSPIRRPPIHNDTDLSDSGFNESPTSMKASRRLSPHRENQERPLKPSYRDIYESLRDTENDTTSSLPQSTRSDSPIEKDSQYAKDLRRVNGAVKSEPQIFRKALVGKRAGLTLENLKRNNDSSESVGSTVGGSMSSHASDPSMNVPRQWGRKARPGNDWLSRINSKSGRLTGDVPKRRMLDDTGSVLADVQDASNKLAAAAAEVPLPSTDNASTSSRSSTPTAAVLRAKSRDRVLDWESQDQDFTGRSLQVSDSPPIRIRNNTLDKILEREIDTVAKRAVTTNRLGELRDKSSAEQLGPRASSRSSERLKQELAEAMNGGEAAGQDNEDTPRRSTSERAKTPSKAIHPLGEGEPVPDTPVVIYRSDSSSSRANDESVTSEEIHRSTSQRPKHDRQDSHSLLRRLARATSASPSPSTDMAEHSEDADTHPITTGKAGSNLTSTADVGKAAESNRSDHDREASSSVKSTQSRSEDGKHATPQQSKSSTYLKTPMVTGAWIDTPLPTGGRGPPMPTPDITDNEQKRLRSDSQKLATGDLIRKLSPHTSRPKMADEELRKTAPKLPRSALESIVNAAKSKAQSSSSSYAASANDSDDPTLLLGDSTIHSLEELIVHDTDVSAILAPSTIASAASSNKSAAKIASTANTDDEQSSPPASPTTGEPSHLRLTDPAYYTSQLSRLSALVPSLRETKAGLASLERSISAPSLTQPLNPHHQQQQPQQRKPPPQQQQPKDKECTQAGEFHDFIWPCERCGCTSRPVLSPSNPSSPIPPFPSFPSPANHQQHPNLTNITIPLPRLWRRYPASPTPTNPSSPSNQNQDQPTQRKHTYRLTPLGQTLLLFLTLSILELWARATFCQPRFAKGMKGYGVDAYAPRPPFVVFKLLARVFGYRPASELGWEGGLGEGGGGGEGVMGTVAAVIGGVVRFCARVVGWIVGFLFGGGEGGGRGRGEPVSTDGRIPRPAWGPDSSMMDDEYL